METDKYIMGIGFHEFAFLKYCKKNRNFQT